MICLHITTLCYPDPASRKILTPKYPVYEEVRGEDNAGWYSVHAAMSWYCIKNQCAIRRDLEGMVVIGEGEVLAAVVSTPQGTLRALLVGTFSSPDDSADFFEETPLLTTLPDVAEDEE